MAPSPRLAVFTKNRVNPAYAAARLAADRVAAEAGARTVHFVPETPDDLAQQRALVGEALAIAPDGVVFVPVDDRQMGPDVARFTAAGIPVVVCINRMDGPFVSVVGSDDIAVGRTAAGALFSALGGNGRIVALEGPAGAPTGRDRSIGLGQLLEETPEIVLLGRAGGAFQQPPAREAMARLLAEHPAIDGVWAANDLMALGALDALAAAGRTARVVGVNGLPEAIEHIARGTMVASVDFSAFNIAGIATHALLRHLRGESVPPSITVPAALIDSGNYRQWQVPFALRPVPSWDEIVPPRPAV
ncbi:sugar ABC transporter substrate-binding protein [Reyranella sp.]|uniref:sugar ABC transporter substrate-binding protein n=1 Tax=Reyranella sp. TaxID=1929291 RepID=UPI003BAC7760